MDENGNPIFRKTDLTSDGNLLPVFRKAAAKYEGKDNFDDDPNQRYETDTEDVLTESQFDGTGVLARLATGENEPLEPEVSKGTQLV